MKKYNLNKKKIQFEKEILSTLSHPNIIKFKAFIENPETNCSILITEFFDGISLADFLSENELKNEEINQLSTEIIASLNYLHNQSVIHNDFNVQNILINPKTHMFKIIDFGVSKQVRESDFQSMMDHQGNLTYRAPKGFFQESRNCYFSDVWGLALVVLSLLIKEPISSKKALKMGFIDIKKIKTMALSSFCLQTNKTDQIEEFFGFGNLKIRTS